MEQKELENWRIEIEKIDREIFRLLEGRCEIVKAIGEYKKRNNLPVRNEQREKLLVENAIRETRLDSGFVQKIYELLFQNSYKIEENSKSMQEKIRIGVMGDIGSFSEEAAKLFCQKQNLDNCEFKYLVTAEKVFSSLENGEIEFAVVGVANSISGAVLTSLQEMAKHVFQIKDLLQMNIRQNILAKRGVAASQIKTIVSQLPALSQCEKFLAAKFPQAKVQEYHDTAAAARDLAEGKLPADAAVICNLNCATLFDLQVLEENIQDNKDNRTTFIMITK